MRIVKIQRVVQSARILPIHVKEGDIRGKSTSFYILVSGRPRSRELRNLVSFQLDKTGPRLILEIGQVIKKFDSNKNFLFDGNSNFVHAQVWTCESGNDFFTDTTQ